MNIFKILKDIEKVEPDVSVKLSRRGMFKQASSISSKVVIAAVPVMLAGVFTKANAKTNESIAAVLNYALTLEYLENEFYQTGLQSNGLIPANRMAIFQQVSKHESAHVEFLKTVLMGMNETPVSKPNFDFTANGMFSDVFSNYETFLALAQGFEDTGVRAYKGRAGELLGNDVVLTAALQIHSVEARHASMIRRLRAEKGWITGNENSGLPSAIYAGEDNISQGGASIVSLGYTAAVATQAFDEPLAPADVLAIAGLFIS